MKMGQAMNNDEQVQQTRRTKGDRPQLPQMNILNGLSEQGFLHFQPAPNENRGPKIIRKQ